MMQLRQAPVAQLDRVFDYESKGRGFESLLACQFMIIRMLSSKWGTAFGFLISIENAL